VQQNVPSAKKLKSRTSFLFVASVITSYSTMEDALKELESAIDVVGETHAREKHEILVREIDEKTNIVMSEQNPFAALPVQNEESLRIHSAIVAAQQQKAEGKSKQQFLSAKKKRQAKRKSKKGSDYADKQASKAERSNKARRAKRRIKAY
jgi:frataxin-like iron-binding protein CyaY